MLGADPAAAVSECLTRPNGVSTNYQYDSLSRLLSVLHQVGANTVDGAAYTLDATGNRVSKSDVMSGSHDWRVASRSGAS